MGGPLSERQLAAFRDELTKEAIPWQQVGQKVLNYMRPPARMGLGAVGKVGRFAEGFGQGAGEAGKRFFNPLYGVPKGWAQMAPAHRVAELTPKGVNPAQHLQDLRSAAAPAQEAYQAALAQHGGLRGYFKQPVRQARAALKEVNQPLKKFEQGGEHLYSPGMNLSQAAGVEGGVRNKARAVAEELSRRGWTGAGGRTKYLPVGQKGMTAGFGAMAIPDIVGAEPASRTGGGGALEKGLGGLGSVGGMVLGGGLGIVPAMALWYAAEKGSSKAGRVLDRLRAGATPTEAMSAPTPQEAQQQLADVYKYYG